MFKNIGFILSLFFISSAVVFGQTTSNVYYQWGNKLYGQGNYDLCIKYYKAAIQVDPQNWKAYQALGSCEYHLGQTDNAIRDFNQSLTLNPNNPPLQGFVNRISRGSAVPSAPSSTNQAMDNGEKQLPKPGRLAWTIAFPIESMSNGDLITDFSPETVSFTSQPIGAEFDFGLAYTFTPNFQLGVQGQLIVKSPQVIENIYSNYSFVEICNGWAVDGKYLLPLNKQFRLVFGGQVGFYSLISSDLVFNDYLGDSATYNLSSSTLGGLIGVDLEWVMDNGGWGIDLGLGYRVLTFNSIMATAENSSLYLGSGGSTQTLKINGSNSTFDFSGPRVDLGVRFF